ncbi:MAG: phytanoyl-CoA dioxygenase family protein [Caulobacteraceae bacterium]
MRLDVTEDQIERFASEGFLVLGDALDHSDLERWRRATDEAVALRLEAGGRHNQHVAGDPFYRDVFTQAMHLTRLHSGLLDLVHDPRLAHLAGTLVGADGMRLWHDQALIKEPYANQTSFHRDTPYWSMSTRRAVNFWLALDDATQENGCLWYLPRTHKLGDYTLVRIATGMGDLFEAFPEWRSIRAVPAPVAAGGLVVHNGMTAHAAGANMTPARRRAMTIAYFPDGELYNGHRDTLPDEYYEMLETGQPLDDDRYVPLVWSQRHKMTGR